MHASSDGRGQEMARSTAILFGAASLITAIGLELPHARQVDGAGLAVVAAVAGVIALVLAWRRERVPAGAYPYIAVAGTILVSLGLLFNGERHGGPVGSDEMFYLWVTLWAAYYFTRRALAVQVAFILVAYAGTLALIHPGDAGMSRFISLGGLVLGAAIVVRMLSERSEQLMAELRDAALTDPLTGLANRRALEQGFAREAAREARTGRPFALLVVDLDHFKRLNDEQGHKAGDRALVEVADVLREPCARSRRRGAHRGRRVRRPALGHGLAGDAGRDEAPRHRHRRASRSRELRLGGQRHRRHEHGRTHAPRRHAALPGEARASRPICLSGGTPRGELTGGQPERWDTTLTMVPLGSRSMNRRTPHSSSRMG